MDLNKNQVIAVDFDGILCKQAWPEIGEENERLIRYLKERRAEGARLILWTNREGNLLEEAVEWCRERGLEFDTVNANLPELIDLYKNDCRKINADILEMEESQAKIDALEELLAEAQDAREGMRSVAAAVREENQTLYKALVECRCIFGELPPEIETLIAKGEN